MPSFDDATVEKWRHERVTQSVAQMVRKFSEGADWSLVLKVLEKDLDEERRRLRRAIEQVDDSSKILPNLIALRDEARRRAKK